MEGMQVPIACLKTQVTTGAMQRLLAALVRGTLVGLGHSGACAWGHSPPITSQTPLLPVSSEVPPPCAHCPLPGDKEPCFFKTRKTKRGASSAFCALRCSYCDPCSAVGQTHTAGLSTQPQFRSLLSPAHSGLFTGTQGTWGPNSCPRPVFAWPEVGTPFLDMSHGRMARGSMPEPHPGCAMDFWMAVG